LQEELDDETRESIHSAAPSTSASHIGLPGSFGGISGTTDEPAKEEVTYLASLVEKLMDRVHVTVSNARISVATDDGNDLELRIDELKFGEQSSLAVDAGVKTAIIRGAKVLMRQSQSHKPKQRGTALTSDSSDADSVDDMVMSRAIADLRDSIADLTVSTASSEEEFLSAGEEEELAQSNQPRHHQAATEEDWVTICSFGSEDIVAHLTRASGELSVAIHSIVVFLLQPQLQTLVGLFSGLSPPTRYSSSGDTRTTTTSPPAGLAFSLKSLTVVLATSQVDNFWERPHAASLPPGSIRLRLDKLSASRDHLTLFDLSLHESVPSPSLSSSSTRLRSSPERSRLLPLLIFDPNLAHQYNVSNTFPTFDMSDWHLSQSEKAWKVRLAKGKRRSSSETAAPLGAVEVSIAERRATFQPLHIFVDIGAAERLSVWADALKHPSGNDQERSPTPQTSSSSGSPSLPSFDLAFSVVRVDVRCPPPPDKKVVPPALLRSGILSLDMHGIVVKSRPENNKKEGKRKSARFVEGDQGRTDQQGAGGARVHVVSDRVFFFFMLAHGQSIIPRQVEFQI
jgi:hypothetical protein